MKYNLGWNMTFKGRQLWMEDILRWKMTLNSRWPLIEDNLLSKIRLKTTFDGRRLFMEDDLQRKTTFKGRQPSMEDDLQWKTTSYREISRFCSAIHRLCGNSFSRKHVFLLFDFYYFGVRQFLVKKNLIFFFLSC